MGGLEQKMRGKTGEMESMRNERIRQRKGREMEMNGGEEEHEAAAAATGPPR